MPGAQAGRRHHRRPRRKAVPARKGRASHRRRHNYGLRQRGRSHLGGSHPLRPQQADPRKPHHHSERRQGRQRQYDGYIVRIQGRIPRGRAPCDILLQEGQERHLRLAVYPQADPAGDAAFLRFHHRSGPSFDKVLRDPFLRSRSGGRRGSVRQEHRRHLTQRLGQGLSPRILGQGREHQHCSRKDNRP